MLTMQYIPHSDIEGLDSDKRVQKILESVLTGKVVLLEGRLKAQEEAKLIEATMEKISPDFQGIELSVVNSKEGDISFWKKVKDKIAYALLGERHGLTIVGPASVLKEIKQDPDKIQLLIEENSKSRNKKR